MSRHGLGSDASRPAALITPCPAAVDQFFVEQLRYDKLAKSKNKLEKNPFIVTYSKGLSYPDNPIFESLVGQLYISYIEVDLYSGNIVGGWFEIRNNPKRMYRVWPSIRTYAELYDAVGKDKDIEYLFEWHLNIVHMSREYLKGGWLYRRQRQNNLEATKNKYVILNKKGFTNILENAKPENTAFHRSGKVE